ncbi:CMRF35-like molecule 7 [Dasypus novemcinctus]|uniref:CMRF35-like molecule 7 n=1 Tax=Dasypus novemcinctus TaxID=9361 RepID=UPI000328B0DA|nr:CMRF35-like molecule 7 [Dasypus novemcinctus]
MWLPPALLLLSLPGCLSIRGPKAVSCQEWESVTLHCDYDPGWETYRKWWCRGADWRTCRILVRTDRSEREVKKGRVSIRDHQSNRSFSVTMENLRRNDTGTYWCGIEKIGVDLGFQVTVTVGSGTAWKDLTASIPPDTRPMDNSVARVSPFIRTHYVLLVFVKVPILLILLGVILWLKEAQKVPTKQWSLPL